MSEKLAPVPWRDEHRVAVIIVNYRTPQLTIACVESLLRSTSLRPQIIIVDNASGDDSVELCRTGFADEPTVTIHGRSINDGYAGGNNAGIALAKEMDARYVFILNSDTIVDPACLRLLVDEAEGDATVGIVAPLIFFGDVPDRIWFAGGRFSFWRGRAVHLGVHRTAAEGWSTRRDLDFATGCALLVRLDAAAALRGDVFDASLFSYAEDLDLSLRVRDAGYRIRFVPEARLWHFEGSSHVRAGGQSLRFYLATRNHLRVVARHARWYHWLTLVPMLGINVIARFCAVAIRNRDGAAVAAVLRGAWHSIVGGKHGIEPRRSSESQLTTDRNNRSY